VSPLRPPRRRRPELLLLLLLCAVVVIGILATLATGGEIPRTRL
jgi:hypothetical protein